MHLTTTFWSDTVHAFHELWFVDNHDYTVHAHTDLRNAWSTYLFFRTVSRFMTSKQAKESLKEETKSCFQFAVKVDGKLTPIKWFDLHVGNDVISHDIAFWTTLIRRNGERVPLGRFPIQIWNEGKDTAKFRELNIKRRAYMYIANRVKRLATYANKQVDVLLDALVQSGLVLEEDVAWIAVTQSQINDIAATKFVCPIRHTDCCVYRGVEFRVSEWAKPNHVLYPVWNISKRTKELMNKRDSGYNQFKEVLQ